MESTTAAISADAAEALARRAHGSSRTKAGGRFIDHVRRVAASLRDHPDPYAVPAALLHDAVEKGSLDWADLRAAGADDRLVALVEALTEHDDEPERDYLARCAADPLALEIKRADLADKLRPPGRAGDERLREAARRRLALLDELASGG